MTTVAAAARPRQGRFPNSMEYVRFGDGPRTLLFIPGGPGSEIPRGAVLRVLARQFRAYLEAGYTVWVVTRRRGMPEGHGVADMADDYAQLIATELGGRVDLVVGLSYGGMIAQYLAANHPDRFGHVALVVAAARVTDWGKDVDTRMGAALATGDRSGVGAAFAEYLLPSARLAWLRRLLGPALGRLMVPAGQGPRDGATVEVEAELAFDSRADLPRVTVPVLMVCGERDRFFPPDLVRETAALLPRCEVVWYPGKGHIGTGSSRRVPHDVLGFVGRS